MGVEIIVAIVLGIIVVLLLIVYFSMGVGVVFYLQKPKNAVLNI